MLNPHCILRRIKIQRFRRVYFFKNSFVYYRFFRFKGVIPVSMFIINKFGIFSGISTLPNKNNFVSFILRQSSMPSSSLAKFILTSYNAFVESYNAFVKSCNTHFNISQCLRRILQRLRKTIQWRRNIIQRRRKTTQQYLGLIQ
jgi:hypothetical protein